MNIEKVQFGGWANCLRLATEQIELIVTLDVGPRVLSCRVPGGKNVLKEVPEEWGTSGELHFVARGGHRFWLAPEDERTYAPDNAEVAHELLPNGVRLENPAADPWQIKKELIITVAPDTGAVTLEHRATNLGTAPATLATWALTVMQPGGLEIIPNPPLGEHPRDLLPNRQLVLWPYTDMRDERWRWGRRFLTLKQTPHSPPAKLGLAHRGKWIGYLMRSALFFKLADYEEGATYPDFGCNFETFTNSQLLEIETLSPLRTLAPGESAAHSETWRLFGSIPEPESLKESALAEWLAPFLAQLGLP